MLYYELVAHNKVISRKFYNENEPHKYSRGGGWTIIKAVESWLVILEGWFVSYSLWDCWLAELICEKFYVRVKVSISMSLALCSS